MAIGTLTTKGQITIPQKVRERLCLKAGDKIEFRVEKDGSVTLLPLARRAEDVFGLLARFRKKTPVSLDEMNRLVSQSFQRRKR